jgi:hypothetical protein
MIVSLPSVISMRKGGRPDLRPMRKKTVDELKDSSADPPYDTYLMRTIYAA